MGVQYDVNFTDEENEDDGDEDVVPPSPPLRSAHHFPTSAESKIIKTRLPREQIKNEGSVINVTADKVFMQLSKCTSYKCLWVIYSSLLFQS